MTKKKAIAAILVLLVAGIVGFLWLNSGDVPEQAPKEAVTSQAETPPLTSERARELETLLSSGNKDEQAKALVPELRQGEWRPSDIVPLGVTIHMDEGTFAIDEQGGRVNVIVGGTQSGIFIARLAYEENAWLIVETIRK